MFKFLGLVFVGVVVALFAAANFASDPLRPASKYAALPVEQVKAQSASISYEQLARSPTAYTGRLVTFTGKVVQATQGGLDYVLRVNVSRGKYDIWQDTIYVDYRAASGREPRILDSDVVQLWGEFVGIKSYKAVLGQTIQIPHVVARAVVPFAITDRYGSRQSDARP
ncbi:hypothetical protein ACVIQT_008012 [Bradyrhizobium diazoefficiens]